MQITIYVGLDSLKAVGEFLEKRREITATRAELHNVAMADKLAADTESAKALLEGAVVRMSNVYDDGGTLRPVPHVVAVTIPASEFIWVLEGLSD